MQGTCDSKDQYDGWWGFGLLKRKYRYGRARGRKAAWKGVMQVVPGTWEGGKVGIKTDLMRVSVSDLEGLQQDDLITWG